MPVPDPLGAHLGALRAEDRGQHLGEHLLHHDQTGPPPRTPAALLASPPRRRPSPPSLPAAVRPAWRRHQASRSSRRVPSSWVIPLLFRCLGGLPNPASTARPGEGSPPQFNKLRDKLAVGASVFQVMCRNIAGGRSQGGDFELPFVVTGLPATGPTAGPLAAGA